MTDGQRDVSEAPVIKGQNTKQAHHSALQHHTMNDNSNSKRPRDARLIHMILANLGVTSYQERVPLQLMDFAYRYTSSTLQDALHLTQETQIQSGKGGAANADLNTITLPSLRLSVASRTHYQFNPTLPKEFYQDLATERNRVALPQWPRDSGLKLPPERYRLTGTPWSLKDEWESETEADTNGGQDGGPLGDMEVEFDGGDEEEERMEDVFGEQDVNEDDQEMNEG